MRHFRVWVQRMAVMLGVFVCASNGLIVAMAQGPDQAATILSDAMKADQAYDQGSFADASQIYESIHQRDHANGHVYFNLGNAYFRQGDLGRSVAAYLAARHYLPRDPDVAANLDYVLSRIPDRVQARAPKGALDTVFFWVHASTEAEQVTIALLVLSFFFGAFAVAIWSPALRSAARIAAFVTGLAFCVTIAGLVWKKSHLHRWGSLVSEVTQVYSGPSDQGNAVLFTLNQGAPIRIADDSGDWIKLILSDGKKGWVRKDAVVTYL